MNALISFSRAMVFVAVGLLMLFTGLLTFDEEA